MLGIIGNNFFGKQRMKKNLSIIVALFMLGLVNSCGGGGGGSDPEPTVPENPLVGHWQMSGTSVGGFSDHEVFIDSNGVVIAVTNWGGFFAFLGKIDLETVDVSEPAPNYRTLAIHTFVEAGPPFINLATGGPSYWKSGIAIETQDLISDQQIRLNLRTPKGGVSVPLYKANTTEPFFRDAVLTDFVGYWQRNNAVFSSPDVDYKIDIDSAGQVTGSYKDVCAIEGHLNAAETEPAAFVPYMDLAFTGCTEATEYTAFPLIFEPPPSSGLPPKIIVLEAVNEDGVIFLTIAPSVLDP